MSEKIVNLTPKIKIKVKYAEFAVFSGWKNTDFTENDISIKNEIIFLVL